MKRKLLLIGVALALLTALIVPSVVFAAAQRMDLRANPPTWGVPPVVNPVAGFAILNNDNDANQVVVVVSLKEGAGGATYGVFLEEYKTAAPDGTMPKWNYLGDLTTNSNGKGNFDFRVSYPAGTYYLQVVLSRPWGSWGPKSFASGIAAVTIK